jgi:hypothetical protein
MELDERRAGSLFAGMSCRDPMVDRTRSFSALAGGGCLTA